MAESKTTSYLSSIKEVPTNKKVLSKEMETQKAIRLALRKDYDGALDILTVLEDEDMINIIKKCIDLEPLFEQFLNGDITLGKYKRSTRNFPDEAKDIVHYKYPNLEFIELRNLERKFREKIEGIIDDLLSKNTLDSLIEARKVYEKNIGVVKKPYNFDRLFLKTISFIPLAEYEPLYYIEWSEVDTLINNYLLQEAKDFNKAETIIKEIKVIDKNRDVIQTIIKRFNKAFDSRLRQNYREAKLKNFVREYNKHTFYALERQNKVVEKTELFFLQRRIYSVFYLNENCELFLGMLKTHMDCMSVIPFENQKAFYHGIIRSIRKTGDYSIFEYFPEKIINGQNFIDVIQDSLEEDEFTIRGIVAQLKGKNNQEIMESLFLKVFKKELSFSDTKKAPEFNKENSEVLVEQYKLNDSLIHKLKARRILYKIVAAFELIMSALFAIGVTAICGFAFRKQLYFLGVVLLLLGLVFGIWSFVRLEDVITTNREKRLLRLRKNIDELQSENIVILKKVYLGID